MKSGKDGEKEKNKDKGKDGNEYEIFIEKIEELETLIQLRKNFAYGTQRDYFDHANCIGWVREGDEAHEGCAVLMSNGDAGNKTMDIGKRYAGKTFIDSLGKVDEKIVIDDDGNATFLVAAGAVSVWISETAKTND